MSKDSPFIKNMEKLVSVDFPEVQAERIIERFRANFERILSDNAGESKAMKPHTHDRIYPAIAYWQAFKSEGMEPQQAADYIYDAYAKFAQGPAAALRKLMALPGLYKLMPAMWRRFMPKLFGRAAGFEFKIYKTKGRRYKFDMLRCPYCEVCKKYGCPELVPAFCNTDVVAYGNMHPRLTFARTKTLGQGGDCCDFDLYVNNEE